MIFVYGYCHGRAREAEREYRRMFPNRRRHPSFGVFIRTFRRLRQTGSVQVRKNQEGRGYRNIQQYEENIIERVVDTPELSVRQIGRELQIPHVSVWRVLHQELLHPYHYQQVQHLQEGDNLQRLLFCNWILQNLTEDPLFLQNIIWSDESLFPKNGLNNFRNLHQWSLQNPHLTRRRAFQRRFKINMWGVIFRNKLFLFEINGILNGQRYLELLQNSTHEILDEVPLNERQYVYFLQDGAPPHNARDVSAWLTEN
uniref:DUF4817 domain-containing protein n=1 Tax=Anoplophora glabripennis TaxID=217634 RepID=V5I8V2_ANOGL